MRLRDENGLADAVRRGKLTTGKEAQLHIYLATHPEERASWDDELSLNHLLGQVPDAPISSNFTARVLELAAQDNLRSSSPQPRFWRWLVAGHWAPKLATMAAAVCLSLLGYHQHQLTTRKEVARTLATMAVTGNSLELLENFDAIQRLTQVPRNVDRDLIAALQ
jgi:hypothetical protein